MSFVICIFIVFLLSAIVGVSIGFFTGLGLADGYLSKKTCIECRRSIVEYGFHSDGKVYIAVEKDKAKREGNDK